MKMEIKKKVSLMLMDVRIGVNDGEDLNPSRRTFKNHGCGASGGSIF
jgi:hypothetical protein